MLKLKFIHPRYWLTWLGLMLLWLLAQLPYSWQMAMGKSIGLLAYKGLKRRRFISCVNLEWCFPEKDILERRQLNREHFISLGQGLIETAMSWWTAEKRLQSLSHIEGLEHLERALQKKQGVILLSAHFTSLELGGRLLAMHLPLHVVYRPHQNPLIEHVVASIRAKRYGKTIAREQVREIFRSLSKGQAVWYAMDQNFGHKNSVFVPFFSIPAATNTATSRFARLSKAQVVPFFTVRLNNQQGYLLRMLPAFEHFPSNAVTRDAEKINRIIEDQVRLFPEQYLWTHRRFKDRPEDKKDRYQLYQQNKGNKG